MSYYTWLRNVRDWKAMLIFIVMPILLTLLLGTALEPMFSPKVEAKVQVGIVREPDSKLTEGLQQFLSSKQVALLVQLTEFQGEAEAAKQLNSGQIEAYLIADEGSTIIKITSDKEVPVLTSLLESFAQHIQVHNVLSGVNPNLTPQEMSEMLLQQSQQQLQEVKIATKGIIPLSIDYYGIKNMFQCLLFGAMLGILSISREHANHIHQRVMIAPVSRFQITMSRWLGNTLTLFSIAIIVFFILKYGVQTNLDAPLWIVLVVLLLYSMIPVSIGMCLAYVTGSMMISSLVVFIVTMLFTLVSGGYAPMEGKLIDVLQWFTPNYYAHEIMFGAIYENHIMPQAWLGLVLLTCACTAMTVLCGRRQQS